jgi:hypothetical protein
MRTNGAWNVQAWEHDFGPRVSGGRLVDVHADDCEVFAGWYVGEVDQTSAKMMVVCALIGGKAVEEKRQ